jgi:hypothetical protein
VKNDSVKLDELISVTCFVSFLVIIPTLKRIDVTATEENTQIRGTLLGSISEMFYRAGG